MASFSNRDLKKNSRSLLKESLNGEFKFVCKDGIIMENKLKFVDTVLRQSKFWSRLFDCCEVETIFLPDIKKDTLVQTLKLLFTGSTNGKESEFEEFYETLLYLFDDIPGHFSNITTNDFVSKSVVAIQKKKNNFSVTKSNVCEICLEYFSSKLAKDRHIKNEHKKSKGYKCDKCNASFRTETGLRSHVKAKHEGTKRHICETCGLTYKNIQSLLRHCRLQGHSEPLDMKEKTIPFQFSKCTICFKLVKDLEYHHEVYHCVTSMHQCNKCDYKTKRKDNLLRHERQFHKMFNKQFSAIKKYLEKNSDWTCQDCGKTLSNDIEIETHLIMKCKEDKNTCKVCGKTFPQNSNLRRHMKTVHEKGQQFSCERCGKIFKHEYSQKRHIAKCKDLEENDE